MTRVIHKSHDTRLARATADGDALWLDRDELERATGWLWKPHGLCRDETSTAIIGRDGKISAVFRGAVNQVTLKRQLDALIAQSNTRG